MPPQCYNFRPRPRHWIKNLNSLSQIEYISLPYDFYTHTSPRVQNITFDNTSVLLTHIPAAIPKYVGCVINVSVARSPIPQQSSEKPIICCAMANFLACVTLATLSAMLIYHGSSADLTVFIFLHQNTTILITLQSQTKQTQSKSPPTPYPHFQ